MTNITTQQARARFTTIPQILQNEVFSVQNAEVIEQISKQNNLPDEKIGEVAEVVGFALLGFIHPEDVAKEVEERAEIPPALATAISEAINKKIFASLRNQLDEIYAPAPHDHELEEKPPVFVEEIRPPVATAPSAPKMPTAVQPVDINKIFGPSAGSGQAMTRPIPPPAVKPFGAIQVKPPMPPAPSTATGMKVEPPKPPVSQISPIKPASSTPTSKPPGKEGLSEFERLGLAKKLGEATEPTVLYKAPEAKLGEKVSSFKIETPIPKFDKGKPFDSARGITAPLRPAVLEFGTGKPPAAPPSPKAAEGKARIVNYSDLKTTLPPVAPKPAPEREIREFTAKEAGLPTSPSKISERNLGGQASGMTERPAAVAPSPIKPFDFASADARALADRQGIKAPEKPAATPMSRPLLGDEKAMHPSLEPLMKKSEPPSPPATASQRPPAPPPSPSTSSGNNGSLSPERASRVEGRPATSPGNNSTSSENNTPLASPRPRIEPPPVRRPENPSDERKL
ncbi:MAG: hypothetical protein AAB897_03625 [Patescibacteria group bacterium]